MTDTHHAHITQLYRELAQFAAGISPAKLPIEPTRGEVLKINDDLELLAKKVDAIVEAYAEYAQASTGYGIDERFKRGQLFGAIDGNLTYEIEAAADEARERLLGVA